MQLKTSFFNPTLFRKNLSRSWPLWGGISAVGALFPLYLVLALNQPHTTVYFFKDDFVELLYAAVTVFVPVFTAGYAILVAMFIWSYLHNARSVGMLHALAIDRKGLFVTNTLSGLAMLLIPYVVVGGLMSIIAACCGAMHLGAVFTTIFAVLLENLLFFGMGTLCAMVTGNVIVTAVYYVVLNFAVPALDALVNLLATQFLFGITSGTSEWSTWFSPLIALYDKVQLVYPDAEGVRAMYPVIEKYALIVMYGIVGIAMLALSYLLYHNRRSESAGDVVAFVWLRPVFRFGIALVSALTLGFGLYEVFWVSLFQEGRYEDMLPMAICMMVGAVVGYYAASMFLEKSLRVFKGSLKGVGIVCAAVALLCVSVALDIFGLERYVPKMENIETVQISGYLDILNCDPEQFPNLCEDILELHTAIVENKDYIRTHDGRWGEDDEIRWRSIRFIYHMKNGSEVERYYYLPLSQNRLQDTTTYDGKFVAVARHPDVLLARVLLPEGCEMVYGYVEYYNPTENKDYVYEMKDIDKADWDVVYEALQRDAREGNFVMDSHFWEEMYKEGAVQVEQFEHSAHLYVQYRATEGNETSFSSPHRYGGISIDLQPTMTHTLRALIAIGAVSQQIIDSWSNS